MMSEHDLDTIEVILKFKNESPDMNNYYFNDE